MHAERRLDTDGLSHLFPPLLLVISQNEDQVEDSAGNKLDYLEE